MTDKELEDEILRRRRARAAGRTEDRNERQATERSTASPQAKQIAQYYANLELKPGASLEDVKRAYRELMRKYHPDKHFGDATRHRAATELAESLTKAYGSLVEHLKSS
jgi:DnaJ-domain-containing protein 1